MSYLWYAGFITSELFSKFRFVLVPPIVFSFRAQAFFFERVTHRLTWNDTCVTLKITNVWIHLLMFFLNSKFTMTMVKCCLSRYYISYPYRQGKVNTAICWVCCIFQCIVPVFFHLGVPSIPDDHHQDMLPAL